MAAHYKVAAAHGHQANKVVAEARERQQTQSVERIPDAPSLAQQAVTYAKERGFEREAVSDERLLMRDALRRGMGDITYQKYGGTSSREPLRVSSAPSRHPSTPPAGSSPRPKPWPWNGEPSAVFASGRIPPNRSCRPMQLPNSPYLNPSSQRPAQSDRGPPHLAG